MLLLVGFIVAFILATIVGNTAHHRGQSYWLFFFLSFFLSPVVGVVVLALLPNRANAGHYIIPPRHGPEAYASQTQKDTLRELGLNDSAILESLGERQATNIIAQLRSGSRMEWGTLIFALLLCPLIYWWIHSLIAQYRAAKPLAQLPGLDATPALAAPVAPTTPPQFIPPPVAPAATPFPIPPPAGIDGPFVVTRPISLKTRYGKVSIPAGTQITVLSVDRGQLQISCAGDVVTIPAAWTNYPP